MRGAHGCVQRPYAMVARIMLMVGGEFILMLMVAGVGQGSTPGAADAGLRAAVLAEERARIETIRRVTPSVACLFAKDAGAGGGSGVIIDSDGYGLTNFHVVMAMLKDRVGDAGLANGKKLEIQVLGIDPHGDVAMFRIGAGGPFTPAVLGDADTLQVGDPCLALGNPFLLAEDYTPTATFGIVSGLHRYQWGSGRALNYTDCIQVDTSINPGNSGGPLFDMEGRLVGINGRVSIEERGRVNVGVGYAITINQIRRFIPSLRAGLTTPHAAAGFTVQDASRKVFINQILSDSAAYRAGLRLGDQIARFGGVEIRSANQFLSQLGTYPAGWRVEIVYLRDDQTLHANLRLDTLPMPETRQRPMPPGHPKLDPYAPTKQTRAANRRAVRRLFELYAKGSGGRQALSDLMEIHARGKRRNAGNPTDAGTMIDLREQRDKTAPGLSPVEQLEQQIRWKLIRSSGEGQPLQGVITGSDEASGQMAAVVEVNARQGGEEDPEAETTSQPAETAAGGYRLWMNDADGRLLAVEFGEPGSKRTIRFEYGEEKRCGPLKLPFHRRMFVDDQPATEDLFETVEVTGKGL